MVDRADQSVGGAIFSTSYTIGGGLGTALSSLVVTGRQNAGASLLDSLKAAFGFTAAMAWFGTSHKAMIRLRADGSRLGSVHWIETCGYRQR